MSQSFVDLIVDDCDWLTALPELQSIADHFAQAALRSRDLEPTAFAVSLLACNDDRIADLNAQFRGKPSPTNVLSWPTFDLSARQPGSLPDLPSADGVHMPQTLGDVAIALQTCEREAKIAAIPLKNHVSHLILHGCLHLLGFDHEIDEDADLMERIESTTLLGMGLPDPYA